MPLDLDAAEMTHKELKNGISNENQEIQCKECHMKFTDDIRLKRHFMAAHKQKHDGFRQKWYWEN